MTQILEFKVNKLKIAKLNDLQLVMAIKRIERLIKHVVM